MLNIRKVSKNTIVLMVTRFINPVISLLLVMAIARYLKVEGLGNYSLIMTYFNIAAMASLLGLNDFIVRDFSKKREQGGENVLNIFLMGFISSAIMILIMITLIYGLNYPQVVLRAAILVSFSLIPSTINNFCGSICSAYERMEFTSLILIISNLSKVLLSLYFLKMGRDLIYLMAAVVITQSLTMILSFFLVRICVGKIRIRISTYYFKKIFYIVPVFFAISLVSVLYWKVDIIMLSKIKDISEVGFYSAAYKIMEICKFFPASVALAVFPVISILSSSNKAELKRICNSILKYLLLIIIPILLFVSIFSTEIISILYGDDFLKSALALKILIWTLVPFSGVLIFAYVLISCNKQKLELKSSIIGLVINILFNAILIPKFGFIGAALSTFLSAFVFLIARYIFTLKSINIDLLDRDIVRIIFLGIFVGFLSFFINLFINNILTFLLCVSIYIFMLSFWGVINKTTFQNAITLFKKATYE